MRGDDHARPLEKRTTGHQGEPAPLFRAFHSDLFAKIARETGECERRQLIGQAKKLARKANISLPRREFEK
jgi:hypothetical protein